MFTLNLITLIILFIGGLNWGLVGIFNWNLVDAIFGVGSVVSTIIYILVGISTLWLIINAIANRGEVCCCKCGCDEEKKSSY